MARPRVRLASYVGLPAVPNLPFLSLLSTAFLSISFLVFLNTAQAFVLSSLLSVPPNEIGATTGNLILFDECWSLILVLVYGAIIDRVGVREVASFGHAVVGLALIGFVNTSNVYYQLIAMRLLYATGAAALVTSLTAGLSILSSTSVPIAQEDSSVSAASPLAVDERSRLLAGEDTEARKDREQRELDSGNAAGAQFAGLIGFTAGCGALLAVFGYLRLPPLLSTLFPSVSIPSLRQLLSSLDTDEGLQRGLRTTFYIIASLAFAESIFLYFAFHLPSLPFSSTSTSASTTEGDTVLQSPIFGEKIKEAIKDLGLGFAIGRDEIEASLAYSAAFATRAGSLVVAAFFPLLINNYFLSHDLCESTQGLAASTTCRPAYILASTLSGIIQLTSLLCSPLVGSISSRISSPLLLSITLLLGCISFISFALLPMGDPRNRLTWATSVGMGICQAGGLVSSLGLVSRVRERVSKREGREVGGAVGGAYSFAGGLGILAIGKASGGLFDSISPAAPFVIIGILNGLVALFSFYVWLRQRSEVKRRVLD